MQVWLTAVVADNSGEGFKLFSSFVSGSSSRGRTLGLVCFTTAFDGARSATMRGQDSITLPHYSRVIASYGHPTTLVF